MELQKIVDREKFLSRVYVSDIIIFQIEMYIKSYIKIA